MFWRENPSGFFLGGDVASSRQSILLRGLGAVAHLFQGGWTETDNFSVPVRHDTSVFWELPAGAGKLILFVRVAVGSRG